VAWPDDDGGGTVRVLDLATGGVVREIASIPGPIATSFEPGGQRLVIASSQILDIINASAARQVVVLLDCCYSGALAATMRADCQKGRSRYRPA
jgi:hypothetical protein